VKRPTVPAAFWRCGRIVLGVGLALGALVSLVRAQPTRSSPLTPAHVRQINEAFKREGIARGSVALDRAGRLELSGHYDNERQVDRAFSIAQAAVGVRWVSPVTPQHIAVKAWEECLSQIFSGGSCGPSVEPAAPDPPERDVAPGAVANKYAILVGTGRFLHGIQPLDYANKDAYDFYEYLIDPAGGRFKRENVVLLRDEYATRANVTRALEEVQRRAGPDDLVVLFLSSHGTPPDKYGGVHVVTYDSEVTPRERIWQTSLTDQILGDFVRTIPARRLVVVMDACYSNGAYNGIRSFLPPGGKSLDTRADEGYGRSSRYMAHRLLGVKDLVLEKAPLSLDSPASPSDGWGKVLISASDAEERSWESAQLRNSVFTRYFIEGLRLHRGSIAEAFAYARPLVSQQVKREKGADIEQNPQLTPSRQHWQMSLAVAER
jgi:Caspase domain